MRFPESFKVRYDSSYDHKLKRIGAEALFCSRPEYLALVLWPVWASLSWWSHALKGARLDCPCHRSALTEILPF